MSKLLTQVREKITRGFARAKDSSFASKGVASALMMATFWLAGCVNRPQDTSSPYQANTTGQDLDGDRVLRQSPVTVVQGAKIYAEMTTSGFWYVLEVPGAKPIKCGAGQLQSTKEIAITSDARVSGPDVLFVRKGTQESLYFSNKGKVVSLTGAELSQAAGSDREIASILDMSRGEADTACRRIAQDGKKKFYDTRNQKMSF